MRDAVHGHHDVAKVVANLAARDTGRRGARASSARGKRECVSHREHGEVDVHLGRVYGLALVVFVHLLRTDAVVIKIGRVAPCRCRWSPRTRTSGRSCSRLQGSQDDEHLAGFDESVNVSEDVDAPLATITGRERPGDAG